MDICTVRARLLAPSCVRTRSQYVKPLENTGLEASVQMVSQVMTPGEHSVQGCVWDPKKHALSQNLSSVKMVSAFRESITGRGSWGCPAALPNLEGQLPETPMRGEGQGLELWTHWTKQCWKYLSGRVPGGNRWHPQTA